MTPLSEDRRERAFCGVGVRNNGTGWLFSLSPLLALSMSCARCPTPFAQQHLKLLGPPNSGRSVAEWAPSLKRATDACVLASNNASPAQRGPRRDAQPLHATPLAAVLFPAPLGRRHSFYAKMEPGCSHSGAGTSAAAEGGEGAVTGGEGCSGTRTPEAESGAREARAAVVPGGGGPAVSVDTSDSTPPAEEGLGRTVLSAGSSGPPSGLGDVHVHATVGGKSPELVSGVAGTPFFYSQVSAIQDQVAGGAAVRTPAEAAVERAGVRTGRGGGRRARTHGFAAPVQMCR